MVSLRTNLFKVNFIILYLYFTFLIDAMFSLVAILLSDTFCVNTLSKDPLSTSQKTVYRRIIIFREEFIIRDKRVLWNLTTTPPPQYYNNSVRHNGEKKKTFAQLLSV